MQLDQLVYPECAAHGLSAAHHTAAAAAAVKQAAYSLDCFLKDYGTDGCCNEGAQYYRHAGLTLWGCLEILSAIAPEASARYSAKQDQKILRSTSAMSMWKGLTT